MSNHDTTEAEAITHYQAAITDHDRHQALLRIVSGAIRNACHDHPEIIVPNDVHSSLTKRIVKQILGAWERLQ